MNCRNICDVNNRVLCIVLVNFADCRGAQLQVNFKNFWKPNKMWINFPMTARRPIFEKHIIALVQLQCGAVWSELWLQFSCRSVVQRGLSNINAIHGVKILCPRYY